MDAGQDAAQPPKDPTGFHDVGSLKVARSSHTATRLQDGRVLVVGGETLARVQLDSVEIFDPKAETWTDGPKLPAPRANHIAELLADGRVLVAGGGKNAPIGQPSGNEVTDSALLFDPAMNAWTETGKLHEGRSNFRAARLASGKVLVAGGGAGTHLHGSTCNGVPNCGPLADALASAELYDAASGAWTQVGALSEARFSFSMTLMPSGRVIAVGGVDDAAGGKTLSEIFDPMTSMWSAGPSLVTSPREHHAAALLGSGALMVAGGKNPNVTPLRTVEILSGEGGKWAPAPYLPSARTVPGLVTLLTGHALVVGGYSQLMQQSLSYAALYDEASKAWVPIASLHHARGGHSTTLLEGGAVLVAGGFDASELKTCEVSD